MKWQRFFYLAYEILITQKCVTNSVCDTKLLCQNWISFSAVQYLDRELKKLTAGLRRTFGWRC